MPHQISEIYSVPRKTNKKTKSQIDSCSLPVYLPTLKRFIDFDFDPFDTSHLGAQIPLSHARFFMNPTVTEIIALVKCCTVVVHSLFKHFSLNIKPRSFFKIYYLCENFKASCCLTCFIVCARDHYLHFFSLCMQYVTQFTFRHFFPVPF